MPNPKIASDVVYKLARALCDSERISLELKAPVQKLSKMALRELEMIPKYLELAQLKGIDRFTSVQVNEIKTAFSKFNTELSRTDLLKELLSIGEKEGGALTTKEITNFLELTTGLEAKEQQNVLKFLKALKEKPVKKCNPREILESMTFEKFKAEHLRLNPNSTTSEKRLREIYKDTLKHEENLLLNYSHYRGLYEREVIDSTKILSKQNLEFVRVGLAECKNPQLLVDILETERPSFTLANSVPALEHVYEISGGNLDLVLDLVRAFHPSEVFQIAKVLSEEGRNLRSYKSLTSVRKNGWDGYDSLIAERRRIFKALNLSGKIKPVPLESHTPTERITILQGDCGRGKRRR